MLIAPHRVVTVNASTLQVNRDSYDPTRTTALRNAFARDMKRRFDQLKKAIKEAIIDQDCFGLIRNINPSIFQQITLPGHRAFQFLTKEQKVKAFMEWLKQQEARGILETTTINNINGVITEPWMNTYIQDSYKRGVARARYELTKVDKRIPPIEKTGGIQASMATPFHIDRVAMLYIRDFEELTGITSVMDAQISKLLAQGIIDGDNPRLIARKLVGAIDGSGKGTLAIKDTLGRFIPAERRAMMLARTEIIRGHHLGMIREFKNWGVIGVTVKAEWSTAMDDRVCDECAQLEGNIYTLEEIENMIPKHPLCRCMALPNTIRDPFETAEGLLGKAAGIGKELIGDIL